jgi:hypothetical protein
VVWGIQARAYADGDALDQAWGVTVEVTDANAGTNEENISVATAAVTPAGSMAAGNRIQFRAYRLGSGADNLAANADLTQIGITY